MWFKCMFFFFVFFKVLFSIFMVLGYVGVLSIKEHISWWTVPLTILPCVLCSYLREVFQNSMSFGYSGGPFSFLLSKTMMNYIVHTCIGGIDKGSAWWRSWGFAERESTFQSGELCGSRRETGSGFEFYVFLHCSKHFLRVFSGFFSFRLLGGTAMLGMDSRYMAVFLLPWLESLTVDLVVSHFFQAVDLVPFRLESTLLGMVCKKILYSSGQNPGLGMVGLAKLLRFFEPLKPWKPLKSTSKIVGEYETLILFQSLTSIFNYLEKSLIFRWTATALHGSVRLSLEEGFYTERHLAPLVRWLPAGVYKAA